MEITWYNIISVLCILYVAAKLWQKVMLIFSPFDFSGKVLFISGGSSGIGEQLAKDFINLGATKVIIEENIDKELRTIRERSQNYENSKNLLKIDLESRFNKATRGWEMNRVKEIIQVSEC
jgi:short-subunit dehydrogenase